MEFICKNSYDAKRYFKLYIDNMNQHGHLPGLFEAYVRPTDKQQDHFFECINKCFENLKMYNDTLTKEHTSKVWSWGVIRKPNNQFIFIVRYTVVSGDKSYTNDWFYINDNGNEYIII